MVRSETREIGTPGQGVNGAWDIGASGDKSAKGVCPSNWS